jgi:hypothetical protein
MDNLTQDVLGSFASLEEAIESAEYKSAAHPTIIEQEDAEEESSGNEELIRRVQSWQQAAKFYWSQAYLAREEKAWERMRACAKQAKDAERFASPEGRLLAAVFGGTIPEAPELAVKRGGTLPDDAVKQARQAVLDEIDAATGGKREQARPAKKAFKTEKVALAECRALLSTLKEGDTFEIEMFYMWGATPFAEHPQFTGAWFKLPATPQTKGRLTVRIKRIYPESEWKRAGKKEAAFFVGEVEASLKEADNAKSS